MIVSELVLNMAERSAQSLHNNILARIPMEKTSKPKADCNIKDTIPVDLNPIQVKVDKCQQLSIQQKDEVWQWYERTHSGVSAEQLGKIQYPHVLQFIRECAMKPGIDVQQAVVPSLHNVAVFWYGMDGWMVPNLERCAVLMFIMT